MHFQAKNTFEKYHASQIPPKHTSHYIVKENTIGGFQ